MSSGIAVRWQFSSAALVSQVNRRVCIRTFKFDRSANDVLMYLGAGLPSIISLRAPMHSADHRLPRHRANFLGDFALSFGSSRSPTGCHQFERALVIRLAQFAGQVAARLFTAEILRDPAHFSGPSS